MWYYAQLRGAGAGLRDEQRVLLRGAEHADPLRRAEAAVRAVGLEARALLAAAEEVAAAAAVVAPVEEAEGRRAVRARGALLVLLPRPLHDPTFSRTVWRLYGGAKVLVMWYYLRP